MSISVNIEAKENKESGGHEVTLDLNDYIVNLKIDSGASWTVLAANALIGDLDENRVKKIKRVLADRANQYIQSHPDSKGIPIVRDFLSATGDIMTGYLAAYNNVKLGGIDLGHFYFYLIPDNKRAIALLGTDFLRYCQYTHEIEGSIFITKFDNEAYDRYYKEAANLDEVISIIDNIKDAEIQKDDKQYEISWTDIEQEQEQDNDNTTESYDPGDD